MPPITFDAMPLLDPHVVARMALPDIRVDGDVANDTPTTVTLLVPVVAAFVNRTDLGDMPSKVPVDINDVVLHAIDATLARMIPLPIAALVLIEDVDCHNDATNSLPPMRPATDFDPGNVPINVTLVDPVDATFDRDIDNNVDVAYDVDRLIVATH